MDYRTAFVIDFLKRIARISKRLFMLDRNMSGITLWNSLIT
jgi:hypothetical protein